MNTLDNMFNAIKTHLQLVNNSPMYSGISVKLSGRMLQEFGYKHPHSSWYDGVIIAGELDGIKCSSAWCMNSHTFESKDLPFIIVIHESDTVTNFSDLTEEMILPENKYVVFTPNGTDKKDLTPELVSFKDKIHILCNKESKLYTTETVYTPVFMEKD